MSTFIEEVLTTVDSDETIVEVKKMEAMIQTWHVVTSKGSYIVSASNASLYLSDHMALDETVSWFDASARSKVATNDQLLVGWSDFIGFVTNGAMTPAIAEYTEQQSSDRWKSFKDLRALHLANYTPEGVIVEAIDANCVTPWDRLDTSLPMPEPDINCVAFLGHGELGWPRKFLKKLFEFSKPKSI